MMAMVKIREILRYFDAKGWYEGNGKIVGTCPIHEGDNEAAFNINTDPNNNFYGAWFCNTQGCHEDYNNDVLGLITGLLRKKDDLAGFSDVINLIHRFANSDPELQIDHKSNLEKFLQRKKSIVKKGNIGRDEIRRRLQIPAQYYVERGFLPETLDHFDVGLCTKVGAPMHNRVVFPVYDAQDSCMLGCVGRSVSGHKFKWINSKGFNKSDHLYNYAKAVKRARETGAMILCEGQGDVMRFHESGVFNAAGLFGCHLSDSQQILLEQSGVLTLIIVMDADKAGQHGKDDIVDKCRHLFNVIEVRLPSGKDIGDLEVGDIQENILPQIKEYV